MAYFDFHNLLSTDDFERLACDVLNIREDGLEFKTYAKGRDGGVDVKCINDDRKIIGQAKLHPSNSFRSLKTELKKEVLKCKKLDPDRYIVITSVSLTPAQTAEIIGLFGGYIKEERDIIDRNLLNDYLRRPEYDRLKMQYSNLLVPDLSYVNEIVDSILNNRIRVQTRREMDELREFHNLYYNTQLFRSALEKLKKDRVIILTGNPGVGKTTTARMLLQNLLVDEGNALYCLNGLQQFDDVFRSEKKQIFLLDDFWGSQFSPELTNHDYVKELLNVVKSVHTSDSHYLILTSRTYIINAVLSCADPDLKKALEIDNFVLSVEDYSDEDSVRILLNHMQFYGFGREYFEYLMYDDTFYRYIHHQNYSPRHVEHFIKYIYPNPENQWKFFDKFFDYLKNPHLYWEQVFSRQTDTAKLIVLILLSASDPIEVNDLRCVFDRTQKLARAELNLAINPLDFGAELKNLDELFIVSDESYHEIWIRFQNPGIKDYLLQYLHKHIDQWGKVLIEGAEFFNQFCYVFSITEEKLTDYYSDNHLDGKKIMLSPGLQEMLKTKIFRDFDSMTFSTNEYSELTNDLSRYDDLEEIKPMKLIMVLQLFNVSLGCNQDVAQFVDKQIQFDIERLRNGSGLPYKAMRNLPWVITRIYQNRNVDIPEVIRLFRDNICRSSEYLAFNDFEKLDPDYFSKYLKENMISIRKHIRQLIIEDCADGFDESEEEGAFVDMDISALFDIYGMKFTQKFVDEINNSLESCTFMPEKWRDKVSSRRGKKRTSSKKIKNSNYYESKEQRVFRDIVNSYIGDESDSSFDPVRFVRKQSPNKAIRDRILSELGNERSIVSLFKDSSESMQFLIDFVTDADLKFEARDRFDFMRKFTRFLYDSQSRNGTYEEWLRRMSEMAVEFWSYSKYKYYNSDELMRVFDGLIVDVDELYPFLIRNKSWFRFMNHELAFYLAAIAIDKSDDNTIYREQSLDIAQDIDHFLYYIERLDPSRFSEQIMGYELKKFFASLDFSSSHCLVMSFLRFFKVDQMVSWGEKRKLLDDMGGGSGNCYVEALIRYLGVDYQSENLGLYFMRCYYVGSTLNDLFMDEKVYPELYERIVEFMKAHKAIDGDIYDIDLVEFAGNPENYAVLMKIGMGRYIIHVVRQILSKLQEKYEFENVYENQLLCLKGE